MRNVITSMALAVLACTATCHSASACESSSGDCRSSYRARYVYVPRVATKHQRRSVQEHSVWAAPIDLEAGASYRLSGGGYGVQLGGIVLRVGGLDLDCDVLTWSDGEVTFEVPPLKTKRPTVGEIHVVSATGRSLSSKPIRLQGIVVEPSLPIAPVVPRIETVEPLPQVAIPDGVVAPSSQSFDLGEGLE